MKSTKTGEERKLRRKFQNYLYLFQSGKRKASLIFSCKTETLCSGQPEVLGWSLQAGMAFPHGVRQNWGAAGLMHPTRKCRYGTTLSLWALILTQSSRTAVKTSGPILTCPCDPHSARALRDFVTHNKVLATPTQLFQPP